MYTPDHRGSITNTPVYQQITMKTKNRLLYT